MLKSILNLTGVQELNKEEQHQLGGSNNMPQCKYLISLDGTQCLCLGWSPNGTGTCSFRGCP